MAIRNLRNRQGCLHPHPCGRTAHRRNRPDAKPADADRSARWLAFMSVPTWTAPPIRQPLPAGRCWCHPRILLGAVRLRCCRILRVRSSAIHSATGDPPDVLPSTNTWLWIELWAKEQLADGGFLPPHRRLRDRTAGRYRRPARNTSDGRWVPSGRGAQSLNARICLPRGFPISAWGICGRPWHVSNGPAAALWCPRVRRFGTERWPYFWILWVQPWPLRNGRMKTTRRISHETI